MHLLIIRYEHMQSMWNDQPIPIMLATIFLVILGAHRDVYFIFKVNVYFFNKWSYCPPPPSHKFIIELRMVNKFWSSLFWTCILLVCVPTSISNHILWEYPQNAPLVSSNYKYNSWSMLSFHFTTNMVDFKIEILIAFTSSTGLKYQISYIACFSYSNLICGYYDWPYDGMFL